MQERHPTLGTAFTSAQMHFVNSLEQLSGGNSFKTTMCKNCESQKGQTHLTSSLSAYFSGLPEQTIEFLIFQLNDTRFSCEKNMKKKNLILSIFANDILYKHRIPSCSLLERASFLLLIKAIPQDAVQASSPQWKKFSTSKTLPPPQ